MSQEKPSRKPWELDHIGHVVSDILSAEEFYCKNLGYMVDFREMLDSQHVEVVFLRPTQETGPNPVMIELISPLPGNQNLQRFLTSRGPGLHHLCYWVPDVAAELAKLKSQGVKLIDQQPRIGSRDMQVAFLHPSSGYGVLVELCGDSPE